MSKKSFSCGTLSDKPSPFRDSPNALTKSIFWIMKSPLKQFSRSSSKSWEYWCNTPEKWRTGLHLSF
ncbi:hypothetical protein ACROYT_G015071 [Oculina patagonica]